MANQFSAQIRGALLLELTTVAIKHHMKRGAHILRAGEEENVGLVTVQGAEEFGR